jgi:hypothetical protein
VLRGYVIEGLFDRRGMKLKVEPVDQQSRRRVASPRVTGNLRLAWLADK